MIDSGCLGSFGKLGIGFNKNSNDGTVTSIGLLLGDTGNDLNVSNSPITSSGDIVLNVPSASSTKRGVLTSTDWNTFNSKQDSLGFIPENVSNKVTNLTSPNNTTYPTTLAVSNAISAIVSGVSSVNGLTGAVVLTTTNISEGSNLYYTTARFNTAFSTKTTTDLTEGINLYYTNTRGINSVLTGYVSGAGTITANDTILQAIQKLNGNISSLSGTYFTNNGNSFGSLATLGTLDNNALRFLANNTETIRIFAATRNVVIQNGGTFTDAGFRLDVNGTARIINTQFVNNGINILTNTSTTGGISLNGTPVSSNQITTSAGFILGTSTSFTSTTGAAMSLSTAVITSTSGNVSSLTTSSNFNVSSGTANFSAFTIVPTLNTTGTYSGIARGLFYNPTLTNLTGATHRAIETVSGDVIFGSTSGNVLIGTTTNSGFRLDVNGTARVTGKITQTTTANSPMGTATLVNGTVTINNTLATTGCYIRINYRTGTTPSTTTSTLVVTTVTNNTSFVVTAYTLGTVTINTNDNNVIEYQIFN